MSSTLGACLKFLEAAHRFFPNTAILFIKRAKRVSKARQLANEIDSYISNGIKGRTYHHLCVLLVKSKSQFHPTFKGRQLHTGVNSRRQRTRWPTLKSIHHNDSGHSILQSYDIVALSKICQNRHSFLYKLSQLQICISCQWSEHVLYNNAYYVKTVDFFICPLIHLFYMPIIHKVSLEGHPCKYNISSFL